jgi:hypothetical protein
MANSIFPGIPGNGSHGITLAKARQILAPVSNIKGGTFSRDIFDRILSDDSVKGIRFYFVMSRGSDVPGSGIPDNQRFPSIVIVGVNAAGNDMVRDTESDGKLTFAGENSWPCPPHCAIVQDAGNSIPI